MAIAITVLALAALGFAGTAVGLAVRNGSLEAALGRARQSRDKSEEERAETRAEFVRYRTRTLKQLENLRDEINDNEDMLAACSDPAVIHERFDRMLQKASSGLGDTGSD